MIIGEEGRRLALVSALYAGLTFMMAYPFSASLGSLVLADAPDTHLYLWTLAWDVYAFIHQPILIFDANIYHPYPNTLAYSENLIGSALFAAPIIWLTGDLVLAMNLIALLTCMLCGTGAYLLARRWQLSPHAAFICGIVFAFAPPRFFRMGQLHTTAVQWIPFTLAFLHSYLERGRRRDLLLALACWTLQVLSSGHGAAFLAVAIVILLAWRLASGQPVTWRQWLRDCGATGAYLVAPSIWILLPYRAAQADAGLRREYLSDGMPAVNDFLASPSRVHVYLQEWLLGRTVNDSANAFLFPGILAVVLAVIAVIAWRPRRETRRASATGFFLVLALVSTLMFVTWPVDTWRHVYWLPGFNFIRVPSRFILLVMLCLGMLSAVAFDRLTRRFSDPGRLAAAVVVSLLLLTEYSSHPFGGVPFVMDVPAIDRWLDTQPKPFVVAEMPVPSPGNLGALERSQTRAMLHSTAHWQRTVHGYSGIRRPLHDQLYLDLTEFPAGPSIDALRNVGVTHVVVHSDYYDAGHWRQVEPSLAQSADLKLVHTEGAGRVYTITSSASAATRPFP
ncbi:MAG: hypothetical protein ACRD1W_12715 [Vicinamibacterales bacterium]